MSRRRWTLRRLATIALAVALVPVAGLTGFYLYLWGYESLHPSGSVVVSDAAGRPVKLESPAVFATPTAQAPAASMARALEMLPTPVANAPRIQARAEAPDRSARDRSSLATGSAPRPGKPAPRPPVRLIIPAIGVNARVVLSSNGRLPRFPGIGWYKGSAAPGTLGNMVLFGHLDGEDATLGRLSELDTGDGMHVLTRERMYTYTVRLADVVDRTRTSVMAPTADSRVTLITCAGEWLPEAQTYDRRLVVIAELSGVRPVQDQRAAPRTAVVRNRSLLARGGS